MKAINQEFLSQFTSRGLAINEGIAIDARLVQSASHPLSEDKLKEEQSKPEMQVGSVNKRGKPMKFSPRSRFRLDRAKSGPSFWMEEACYCRYALWLCLRHGNNPGLVP